jgi:hypothetical protein
MNHSSYACEIWNGNVLQTFHGPENNVIMSMLLLQRGCVATGLFEEAT